MNFDDLRIKHLVYRKLPFKKNKIEWTPTGNSYRFDGNKSITFAEFLNDSIMIEYGQDHESVSINKWWLEEFENYQFLVLEYPTATVPILVDSLSEENVHLKVFDDKIREYKYEQLLKKDDFSEIPGEWSLTDKEYDTLAEQRQDPLSINNIAHLKISEDSIELELDEFKIKKRYK